MKWPKRIVVWAVNCGLACEDEAINGPPKDRGERVYVLLAPAPKRPRAKKGRRR